MLDTIAPRSESPWRLKLNWRSRTTQSPLRTPAQSPSRSAAKSPRATPTQTPRHSPPSTPRHSPPCTPKRSQSPEPKSTSQASAHSNRALLSQAVNLAYDFTVNIPKDIPYPPFVNVEGVPNFRGLGGYACTPKFAQTPNDSSAYAVRTGYVYRCSELSQLTAVGLHTMVEVHQIRKLFDLRSEREFDHTRNRPEGVERVSTPVFRQKDVYPGLPSEQLGWGTAPDEPKNAGFSMGYVRWYRQIAMFGAKKAFRVIFEHIRDHPDEPFVFHCSAGKDRTGVLSALILKLCGVDNNTISWEYALTVPGMGVWEAAVEQEMVGDSMMPIRRHGGMTREEARRICGSRASNMKMWLELILEKEFGGVRGYLKRQCKFEKEDIDKITRNLVAQGPATVKVVKVPGMEDHPQT